MPETASRQELRQAFRGLSKRYHPDTTALPADEAAAGFLRLQQAYAVLSDPVLRQRYDAQLHPSPAPLPPSPPPRAGDVTRPTSVRRDLSGGEWLALLLLGFALVSSLGFEGGWVGWAIAGVALTVFCTAAAILEWCVRGRGLLGRTRCG